MCRLSFDQGRFRPTADVSWPGPRFRTPQDATQMERKRPDQGQLSLYVADHGGRFRLLGLALRALTGTLHQAEDFAMFAAGHFTIHSAHRSLRVSADGQVVLMAPPFDYRIREGALRVMRP